MLFRPLSIKRPRRNCVSAELSELPLQLQQPDLRRIWEAVFATRSVRDERKLTYFWQALRGAAQLPSTPDL